MPHTEPKSDDDSSCDCIGANVDEWPQRHEAINLTLNEARAAIRQQMSCMQGEGATMIMARTPQGRSWSCNFSTVENPSDQLEQVPALESDRYNEGLLGEGLLNRRDEVVTKARKRDRLKHTLRHTVTMVLTRSRHVTKQRTALKSLAASPEAFASYLSLNARGWRSLPIYHRRDAEPILQAAWLADFDDLSPPGKSWARQSPNCKLSEFWYFYLYFVISSAEKHL